MIILSTLENAKNENAFKAFHWVSVLILSLIFFLPLTVFSANSGNEDPKSASENGSWIQITGHSFQGDRLVISYVIQYPGMTKVKLFNSSNQMLWRGQYVNDIVGEQKIILKASVLQPGNYIFEFDYKSQKRNYPLSI